MTEEIFIDSKKPRFARTILKKQFENNSLEIPENGDTFTPLYIICDEDNLEFLNLKYNQQLINKFPLEFCNILSKNDKKIEGKKVYKIHWEIFFPQKELILLIHNHYSFEIETKDYSISNAILYYEVFNYEPQARLALCNNLRDYKCKNIKGQKIKLNKEENIINLNNLYGLTNGFFFMLNNIENIKNIELKVNGNSNFSYNKIELELFCKKITNNLIYIPLTSFNYDCDNYNSAINLSKNLDVKFIISSESEQNGYIIYLTPNLLAYSSGLIGLRFFYGSGFILNKIIQEINKILEGDKCCPIEHLEIEQGEKYMKCTTCKKNFKEESIKKWLEMKIPSNCPHCRVIWQDNTVYVNSL